MSGGRVDKLACKHRFAACDVPDYERCESCGTYHSLKALPPEEIYGKDYWGERWKHGTIKDQNYNVEKHLEHGVSKNDFVMNLIWTQDYSAALEIACAPGSLLRRLAERFETVVGIEVDPAYASEIREMAGPKPMLLFDYFPEPDLLAKESFSLIIGLDIFEHAHEPEAFLAECARLLKRDGQLLLMTPLLGAFLGELPARFFHPIEHVYIHSYENLFHLLMDAGFGGVRTNRWTAGHETVTARKL